MENMERVSTIERAQIKDSLQNKLTNFLDKILEQAGLALEKASEGLRNIIPSSVPTWPIVPLRKILKIIRKHVKPPDRQHYHPDTRKIPL